MCEINPPNPCRFLNILYQNYYIKKNLYFIISTNSWYTCLCQLLFRGNPGCLFWPSLRSARGAPLTWCRLYSLFSRNSLRIEWWRHDGFASCCICVYLMRRLLSIGSVLFRDKSCNWKQNLRIIMGIGSNNYNSCFHKNSNDSSN